MDSHSWAEEFQAFLYRNIAPIVIPDTSEDVIILRKRFVDNNSMPYHIRAVTPENYEPNKTRNNEIPEFIGDGVMGLIFPQMYVEKVPDTDEATLSDLKNSQVWKQEQARLTTKLGLDRFIRSILPIDKSMREDALEAFFWSVMAVGNIISPGVGYVMCKNLMVHLYGDVMVKVDKVSIKNKKSQLKEIGDKLRWYDGSASIKVFGVPKEVLDKYQINTTWHLVYKLPARAREWMQSHGKKVLNNGILADVTMPDKKEIVDEAAAQALHTLKRDYGLDWSEADKYKGETHYSREVEQQMAKDGYESLEVVKYKDINYHQLIGVKKNGLKEIIFTAINDTGATVTNFEAAMIERYGIIGKQKKSEIIRVKSVGSNS